MKVLLLYPAYPDTFFSFKHALKFIGKKAAIPPLGLITIAAMLPSNWEKRFTDLNVAPLEEIDLQWTDYVFISAMYIQKESLQQILIQCQDHDVQIIAGGPLFAHEHSNYPEIDHFILDEGEITLKDFLRDLGNGQKPRSIYRSTEYANIKESPVPEYSLLSLQEYESMNIQISRGCPFACDFCEIPAYLGHKVRSKETAQVIAELNTLYQNHWRGNVSIVDDNFIGEKKFIKDHLLPAMIDWMRERDYPFIFNIQSSIDIADDDELINLMIQAGINSTFIGIETPSAESLDEGNKVQNKNRDMLQSVLKIQKAGMQVSGGFIVGFDSDLPSIFQRQIEFIQKSGIVWAMVGLLNAPKGTALYERLKSENRLTTEASGSNTDYSMNFEPKMNKEELLAGYRRVLEDIYLPKPYYKRIRQFLRNYQQELQRPVRIERYYFKAFIKTIYHIGILEKGRREYWKFLVWIVFHKPQLFLDAIMYTISGYHFRRVYGINA